MRSEAGETRQFGPYQKKDDIAAELDSYQRSVNSFENKASQTEDNDLRIISSSSRIKSEKNEVC